MTTLTDIANKIIDRNSKETIDGHSKHWWQHEVNNARADGYTRGYAAGKKQTRDAAVKVCREYGESVNNDWNKQLGVADDLVSIAEECAEAIAALPVPEVQWRDLTEQEINELWDNAMLVADPTAGNHRFKFARAVIAKFKEKQNGDV